jgi:hypothetical protein
LPPLNELKPHWRRAAYVASILAFYAYFAYFTAGGLTSWFSNDDLMNLHNSLARIVLNQTRDDFFFQPFSTAHLLLQNFRPWGDMERPVGQLFYRVIYETCGFSPLPYRLAAFFLLSLNLLLLAAVCRRLSGSRAVALLVLCFTGLHAGFISDYYDTGMIYDVLAFTFYLAALWLYARLRSTGAPLSPASTVLLLALCLAAVNSKEIALSLPLALLAYEWLWHPLPFTRWLRGPARPALLTLLLVSCVVAAKLAGSGVARSHAAYQPKLSLAAYLESYAHYLTLWTYSFHTLSATNALFILAAVVILSLALRSRLLQWAALMILTSLLPLAFIPPRAAYAFYLPAVFWALWLACLLIKLHRRLRLPMPVRWALPALAALCLLPLHARMFHYPLLVVHDVQNANRGYHDQLLQVLPTVKGGARILVLNDPYPADGFDASFLIRLTYQDMTLAIDRVRFPWLAKRKFDPANYDVVLNFLDNRWVVTQ